MGFLDIFKKKAEPDEFAALVTEALKKSGLAEAVYDREQFRLTLSTDSHVFLTNAYAEYCAASAWSRSRVIERLIASTTALRGEPTTPQDFLRARQRLMPVVRDPLYLESIKVMCELEGRETPGLAYQPFGRDYCLALAYDTPQSMTYVSTANLELWKVPFERALEYALDNLRTSPPSFAELSRGLFMSAWRDNYDASRVLLPEMLRALPVRGRPVVALPHRDCLLVAGDQDPEALLGLAERVGVEIQKPRPIGAIPLVLDGTEWSPFLPEGADRSSIKLRNLAREARGWNYAEQKKMYDQLYEKTGRDIFVASYSGLVKEPEEEIITYCTWSRGVVSLLPCTAEVALFDPESGDQDPMLGMYPWAIVVAEAGRYMKPAGMLPERWLVEEFPDAETLAKLKPHRTR